MFEGFTHTTIRTDTADFNAGNKVKCPVLVLWGAKSHVEHHFNSWETWPQYAANIADFVPLPSGHFPQEQAPQETYDALYRFLKAA